MRPPSPSRRPFFVGFASPKKKAELVPAGTKMCTEKGVRLKMSISRVLVGINSVLASNGFKGRNSQKKCHNERPIRAILTGFGGGPGDTFFSLENGLFRILHGIIRILTDFCRFFRFFRFCQLYMDSIFYIWTNRVKCHFSLSKTSLFRLLLSI